MANNEFIRIDGSFYRTSLIREVHQGEDENGLSIEVVLSGDARGGIPSEKLRLHGEKAERMKRGLELCAESLDEENRQDHLAGVTFRKRCWDRRIEKPL